MKKRSKDLMIGGGLMAIGAGALAIAGGFSVQHAQPSNQASNQASHAQAAINQQAAINSGSGYIQNANDTDSRQYVQEQTQNTNQAIANTSVNQGFNNLANTQTTGPAANNQQYTAQQPTQPQHNHGPSTQGVCAPEALAVGIKHFRYADTTDLVWSGYGSQSDPKYSIRREAKEPLRELVNAAKRDGVTLSPGSIFRSSARQRQIINSKHSQGQSARQIYYTSSHPGFSEHHTGLAVDFTPINNSFAGTSAYRWLRANAHKYGWEQTFTADYAAYSGVSEESWHWRYIGKNGEFAHIFAASKNRAC